MLRLTGVLALLASAAIAVALGTHLSTFDLNGVTATAGSLGLVIHFPELPGTSRPTEQELAFFPLERFGDPSDRVAFVALEAADPEARALPQRTPVRLRGAVLVWRRPLWVYGGISMIAEGRTYACGRSLRAFWGTLILIAAAPLLLWAAAALPVVLLSRRPKREAAP